MRTAAAAATARYRERQKEADPGLLRPVALREYRTWLAEHGEKFCPKCQQAQPMDSFYVDRSTKDGKRVWCVACDNARSIAYSARPETREIRRHNGRKYLLRQYGGMTVAAYEALLRGQGGGCAICGSTETGRSASRNLPVDHDHATGEVRGILCDSCNVGLARFKDNPTLLKKAATYLERGESHPDC